MFIWYKIPNFLTLTAKHHLATDRHQNNVASGKRRCPGPIKAIWNCVSGLWSLYSVLITIANLRNRFEKSLHDLIRGIRSAKDITAREKFLKDSLADCRMEARNPDMEIKTMAILKLAYVSLQHLSFSQC